MTNSTPYELRFKVLEMARDLCMDQYHTQYEAFTSLYSKLDEKLDSPISKDAAIVIRDMMDDLIDATPSRITPAQINAEARDLYEFVSTK